MAKTPTKEAAPRAGLARVPEAEEFLAMSRSKLYAMMDRSELPFVKIGGSRRIRWSDLEELVERNMVGAGE